MLWTDKTIGRHIIMDNRDMHMKFSFIKNDITTYWDEIGLSLITLIALAMGVLLIVFRPSFWIISESTSICFGVLALMLVFMYTPCIIYRLFENKIDKGKNRMSKIP